MTIRTQYDPKPIPDHRFDWEAVEKDYEPGRPIGFGRTEGEATDDLMMQLDDLADAAISAKEAEEAEEGFNHYYNIEP